MRGILPHLPLRVSNRETIEKSQKVPIERTYDDERRPELVKPELYMKMLVNLVQGSFFKICPGVVKSYRPPRLKRYAKARAKRPTTC